MSPEHDVRLEVNPNADDHGNSGKSDGFEALMVVVEEEWSCEQVWLGCFSTTVYAIAFCFDSWPTSCRIREFGATVHDGFDDVVFALGKLVTEKLVDFVGFDNVVEFNKNRQNDDNVVKAYKDLFS